MNNLPLSASLVEAFKSYLLASRASDEHVVKDRKFYISDMGKCLRMRYLKRKGIKGEYDWDTYFTFALGDMIHKLGYKALEAQGTLVATEQYLDKEEHFVGKYDGKVHNGDKVHMFDFKSTNPYVLKRIVGGGADNVENIMQVLTYYKFEHKKDPTLSDTAALVYVNKLPSDKIEPTIVFAREYHYETYKDEIDEDLNKILDYWLTDKIPPCTCPSWSIQKYNAFYMFCHMDEKNVKKHLDYLKAGKLVSSDGYEIHVKDAVLEGGEQ